MSRPTFRRVTDTIHCEVDGDVLALNVKHGQCYGMENVTAAVWALLEQPIDLDAICEQLMVQYEVGPEECRADVSRLLDTMEQENLIERIV